MTVFLIGLTHALFVIAIVWYFRTKASLILAVIIGAAIASATGSSHYTFVDLMFVAIGGFIAAKLVVHPKRPLAQPAQDVMPRSVPINQIALAPEPLPVRPISPETLQKIKGTKPDPEKAAQNVAAYSALGLIGASVLLAAFGSGPGNSSSATTAATAPIRGESTAPAVNDNTSAANSNTAGNTMSQSDTSNNSRASHDQPEKKHRRQSSSAPPPSGNDKRSCLGLNSLDAIARCAG